MEIINNIKIEIFNRTTYYYNSLNYGKLLFSSLSGFGFVDISLKTL